MPIERPFSESDWLATPEPVRRYVEHLEQRIERLETTVALLVKRIDLRAEATFPLLVGILKSYFKEQNPNLGWLA